MNKPILEINPIYSFGFYHVKTDVNLTHQSELHVSHTHENIFEIIMLIHGDIKFHIESSYYKPIPYDILVVRPNELHRITAYSSEPYERYVLHIESDFFVKNNCLHYKNIFINRILGANNIVPATMVKPNILDAFLRLENFYIQEEFLVANAVLLEFLHYLNAISTSNVLPSPTVKNKRIHDILLYIDKHLTEEITLDVIAQQFYINKYYLCKSFKKETGYSLNEYVNFKRLLLARSYHNSGMNLTDASAHAGFKSYSNFYKVHIKHMHVSPKGY